MQQAAQQGYWEEMRRRHNPGPVLALNEAIRGNCLDTLKRLLADGKVPAPNENYQGAFKEQHPLAVAVSRGSLEALAALCDFYSKTGFPEVSHPFYKLGRKHFVCDNTEFMAYVYKQADPDRKKLLDKYLTAEQKLTLEERELLKPAPARVPAVAPRPYPVMAQELSHEHFPTLGAAAPVKGQAPPPAAKAKIVVTKSKNGTLTLTYEDLGPSDFYCKKPSSKC